MSCIVEGQRFHRLCRGTSRFRESGLHIEANQGWNDDMVTRRLVLRWIILTSKQNWKYRHGLEHRKQPPDICFPTKFLQCPHSSRRLYAQHCKVLVSPLAMRLDVHLLLALLLNLIRHHDAWDTRSYCQDPKPPIFGITKCDIWNLIAIIQAVWITRIGELGNIWSHWGWNSLEFFATQMFWELNWEQPVLVYR